MKDVIMPKLGFTMEEGVIVRWLKQAGDAVTQGEPIVEITTDKTNMEIEAPATGVLADVRAAEGDTVLVTQVIAVILGPGEKAPVSSPAPVPLPAAPREAAPREAAPREAAPRADVHATPIAQAVARDLGVDLATIAGSGPRSKITREDVVAAAAAGGKPRATPAARKAARALGVDLTDVAGSGPRGRVQAGDVSVAAVAAAANVAAAALPAPVVDAAPAPMAIKTLPFSGMRKTIALRLQKSAQEAPHITFDADIDVSALEALRARANARLPEGAARISVTAVIARACAWALARHPRINSQLDLANNQIRLMPEANIGIAVALEDGLIVPVVHEAGRKGLAALGAEIADLSARAKANKLKPAELSGGTFTISNLGMLGVDRFTAIINPPESAILAVGRAVKTFVPDAHDQPVLRPLMTIRLSADHRIIDGAAAALFMRDLREALERPDTMLM